MFNSYLEIWGFFFLIHSAFHTASHFHICNLYSHVIHVFRKVLHINRSYKCWWTEESCSIGFKIHLTYLFSVLIIDEISQSYLYFCRNQQEVSFVCLPFIWFISNENFLFHCNISLFFFPQIISSTPVATLVLQYWNKACLLPWNAYLILHELWR